MPVSESIITHKAALRQAALERRDRMPAEARAAAAETIAARPLPVVPGPGAVVSGFSPIRSEINPLPLLRAFARAGARLALPTLVGRGHPLKFREWTFGAALMRGQWGIREPTPEAPEAQPDILLVPLAAYDRRGYRIGYGAGYYDLTLNGLRAIKPITAIGIAFADQEIEQVPALSHDARLDLVVTERDVIDCRGA